MGFEEIRLAVERRIASWDGAPVEMDGFSANQMDENEALPTAIANKQPWVRCTINHGESRAPYKGDKPGVRRTGIVQFQIFTPENEGSRPAAVLADSLADHFQFYRSKGLELLTASVQRVGPDSGWYQYNVTTPFRAG